MWPSRSRSLAVTLMVTLVSTAVVAASFLAIGALLRRPPRPGSAPVRSATTTTQHVENDACSSLLFGQPGPALGCYGAGRRMLLSQAPRVCEIIPFRSQGRSTLLFDYDFGVVRLPRGWAARVPACFFVATSELLLVIVSRSLTGIKHASCRSSVLVSRHEPQAQSSYSVPSPPLTSYLCRSRRSP